jgi:hypothetical protein
VASRSLVLLAMLALLLGGVMVLSSKRAPAGTEVRA